MKSPVLETFLVGVAFGIGITVLSLRRWFAGVGPNQQFELMGELEIEIGVNWGRQLGSGLFC